LYLLSGLSNLMIDPEWIALEYGVSYERFAELCRPLVRERRLIAKWRPNGEPKSLYVVEPENYDANGSALGQSDMDRRRYVRRPLTERDISEAMDLCEILLDKQDWEDHIDYPD
jgi:hypothetical protein